MLSKKTMVVCAAAAALGISGIAAQAGTVRVVPGQLNSELATTHGVTGDGTIGNDSWLVSSSDSDFGDTFWIDDQLTPSGDIGELTIADITRMSLDTKKSGAYTSTDFYIRIRTVHTPGVGGNDDDESTIMFFLSPPDSNSGIDESGNYVADAWNTYEWNSAGNDNDGLESVLHQSESGGGSNGLDNAWLTLKETLDLASQYAMDGNSTNDNYYGWLNEQIDSIAIRPVAASDGFSSQLDNFSFTYDTGSGDQTTVIDFAAVPEPTSLAIFVGLGGLALLSRRMRRKLA